MKIEKSKWINSFVLIYISSNYLTDAQVLFDDKTYDFDIEISPIERWCVWINF